MGWNMPRSHECDAKLSRAASVFVKDMMLVKAGESVLIAADPSTDRAAVVAVQDAAYALRAKVATVVLASALPFQGSLADPFIPDHVAAAMTNCDVCIDLCMPYIGGSKAYEVAMKNGRTRYFLGADIGSEGILRLFGDADLDRVFEVSDCFYALFRQAAGKQCRITSRAGTEVTFTMAAAAGLAVARATEPGGYYAPGTALFNPELDSVKGRIVCETTFHEYYTPLDEPLVFDIDGKVKAVSGGGTELKVMDRALRRAGRGEYGNIVHFTCGFHPAARFTGRSFVEDQRVVGCNAIGLGLPHWLPGGGENHPDCVMKAQSLWIDGQHIIDDSVIVGPPELRAASDKLVPTYG
jgi:leucyl aminopeptidase (aminopeptidase T)